MECGGSLLGAERRNRGMMKGHCMHAEKWGSELQRRQWYRYHGHLIDNRNDLGKY